MIKTIIIDDEPLARSIVKEYLQHYKDIELVAECNDGFEGLKAIQQHQPQLVFLDIQMPKINGFEMLELIENPPSVIFTTAFDEYALKAFETHAIDYLLKPFSKERFEKAVQKYINTSADSNSTINIQNLLENSGRQPEDSHRIVVKSGANIKIIPVDDIIYLEADDDYVKIYTADGYSMKKKTMSYYEHLTRKYLYVYIVPISYI